MAVLGDDRARPDDVGGRARRLDGRCDLLAHDVSWLGWHTVFALFGTITPLFALLTQPHRGSRDRLAATTAVDIAGIAVMTGFLYSRFILRPTSWRARSCSCRFRCSRSLNCSRCSFSAA